MQEEMATYSFLIISLLELLIFILGTFGNFITCCIVFKNKQLQISAYFYVVSLAAADLITCAVLVPTRSLQHLGVFMENTSLKQFGIVFVPVIGRVTILVSFINLAVISIDRLIAVSFPFYYRLNLRNSKKGVAVVILGIWFLASFLTSLPEFQAIEQRVALILFVTCIITMTLIILVSNARVLFIVRRQSRFRRKLLMPTSEAEKKRKVLKNSNLEPVDENECIKNNGQENKASSSFNITNPKLSIQDIEDLNMANHMVQNNCQQPVPVDLTCQNSSNCHDNRISRRFLMPHKKSNKIHQLAIASSPNLRKRECIKEKSDDTRVNRRRHSWPNSFSRNSSSYYESDEIILCQEVRVLRKDISNTDFEMSKISEKERGIPSRRPNANQSSHNKSTFITANIRRTGNKEEKKTAVTFAIVILVFTILVYPRISLIIYHFFYPETFDTGVVRLWLRVLMYANSAVNPVLYAWRMPKFRNAFRSMITCKKY